MRIGFAWLSVWLLSTWMLGCEGSSGDRRVSVIVDGGALVIISAGDCPRCDDPASDTSFGRFSFSSNVTRETAQSLLAVCSFDPAGGHTGQAGDSLQIAACGGGVELAFSSNTFSAFALRSGYMGAFDGDIRIGDPLADVLAREPRLVQVDPRTFVFDDGVRRIEANFDADLRLRELIVGRGFLR